MLNWDKKVSENYFKHYSRININVDPRKMSKIVFGQFQATYGSYFAELQAGSKVLDLGCGAGFILYWLSKQKNIVPVGVDLSPSQVQSAREKFPEIDIFEADGLQFLRESKEKFGAIICTDVLEHLPTMEMAFEWANAAKESLVPGGFFICRMPNAGNVLSGYCRYIDLTHFRSFTSKSILQFMDVVGFDNIEIIQMQEVHWKGRLRRIIENAIHKFFFRLSCLGKEEVFTPFISAVGYKGNSSE